MLFSAWARMSSRPSCSASSSAWRASRDRPLVLVREHREPCEVCQHAQPRVAVPHRRGQLLCGLKVSLRAPTVAAKPTVLAEHHLGPGRVVDVTGGECVSRANQEAVAGHVDVCRCLGVLEREPRPLAAHPPA